MAELDFKVGLIAGATGAAGCAVAQALAQAGYALALSGRGAERLAELAGELELPEERMLTLPGDVSTWEGAAAAVARTEKRFGRLDVLVNLVGGWAGGKSVVDSDLEEVDVMLQQHFYSTFYLARAALPGMLERSWGRLIVVTSPLAGSPPAKSLAYAAGKAAQETVILTVSEEVKGSGVTANALRVRVIDVNGEKYKNPSPKNASWTTLDEIAAAVLFLCSPAGGTINGARLPLYGGA